MSRSRTAACRTTSAAPSRTETACCCKRPKAPKTYASLTLQVHSPRWDKVSMLFIRDDEAEEAWRIIDPMMKTRSAGDVPLQVTQPAKRTIRTGAPEGTTPGTGKVSEDRRWGR
jgi:glucose-6-phosphate 1-dehydrogenase